MRSGSGTACARTIYYIPVRLKTVTLLYSTTVAILFIFFSSAEIISFPTALQINIYIYIFVYTKDVIERARGIRGRFYKTRRSRAFTRAVYI